MQASQFEVRHQTLLSQLLIAFGLATYLVDSEDIVWRFIKDYPNCRQIEHAVFLAATLLVSAGAVLCTWARATQAEVSRSSARHRLGEILYAIGLATLMPLAGFIILIAGQTIRVLRLSGEQIPKAKPDRSGWSAAMRSEAAKWGLLLTMIIFTITLVDRYADVGAGASYALWALLNRPWLHASTH